MAHGAGNAVMLVGPSGQGTLIDRDTAERLFAPYPLQRLISGPRYRLSSDRRERRRTSDFVVRGRLLDVAI